MQGNTVRWPGLLAGGMLVVGGAAICPAETDLPAGSIDEIVVVANKNARSPRDIAASVTVVTRSDINDMIATTVADAFRYTPGIDYEKAGTRFGAQGINIRGINGNRVAILVDGVPVSDEFQVGSYSNATRDFMSAGLIQRIEVLHGPASALYGSAAIGGVVAMRTPDPADILRGDPGGGDLQFAWRGDDNSLHGSGMLAFGNDSLGLLLAGSARRGSEAESAAADQSLDLRESRRRSALVKFAADTQGGRTWRLAYRHQDAVVASDLNSMLGVGRYASTTALEGDDSYDTDVASVDYAFGAPEAWVDAGVLRGYHQRSTIRQSTLDERALARSPVSIDRYFEFGQAVAGVELNLQKLVATARAEHRLGFGLEYRDKRTEEYRDGLSRSLTDGSTTNVILGEVFPLRDFPKSDAREFGAYFEDSLSIGDWSIVAAARADRFDLVAREDPMYAEDYPFAEPVSLSESDLSPKLGVIRRLGRSIDVYVQYTQGFRAPPYEDANIGLDIPFFNYRAIPNPDLRSEHSRGFDIGLRWQGSDSDFRVALFRTDYVDFIESKMRIGEDPVSGRILFQSRNLAAARIDGIEAGGSIRLPGALDSLQLDGSAYAARGRNNESGQPLNSVGPAQAVVGLEWRAASGRRTLRLQTTLTAAWSKRDETGGELFKPAGHALFDLLVSQRLGERITTRLALTNLTDRICWAWTDVGGLSPDDPVLPYLARPGRSATLSMELNW